MIDFSIVPFVGALPITFDMTAADVEQLLGPPLAVQRNWLGELNEQRTFVSIRYSPDTNQVVELSFLPEAKLHFEGRSLFDSADVVQLLAKFDPHPHESVGFLIFYDLGIMVTGIHDGDKSQEAITVCAQGRLDPLRQRSKPYVRGVP